MTSAPARDRILSVVECVVVLGVCALTTAEIALDISGPLRWLTAVAFGAGITLPLLARRRAPLAAVIAVTACAALNVVVNGQSAGGPGPWFAFVLAAFAVGAHAEPARAVLGGLVVLAPTVWLGTAKVRAGEDASALVSPLLFLIAIWAVGRVTAHRRRRADAVERRAQELADEAERIATAAAEQERARIARELHDVVTHGMSVMVVQSQAAQTLAGTDADRAREAMRAVEEAGRAALTEMRRLLGVIRGAQGAQREPPPTLEDVDGLVDRVRRAGLPVTYHAEAEADQVPAGVAVSAYRIVQEALTNVVKHAGPVPTTVRTRHADQVLEVTVTNGRPTAPPGVASPGGAGLAGMRERVAVYDGVLEAGPSHDGGFVVRAILPVGRS